MVQSAEEGVKLFVLAFNPVTKVVSYQTGIPIEQVASLVQSILAGHLVAKGRQEALAELDSVTRPMVSSSTSHRPVGGPV